MKIWDYLIKEKRKSYRKYGYFYKKFSAMNFLKDKTVTLAIGNSHGLYGYRANKGAFNFCDFSQDLYTSFKVYEYYANAKNLKNIILFYSVFSNGFELSKTNSKNLCAMYKYFFEIPYIGIDKEIEEDFNEMSKTLKRTDKIKNFYGNFKNYKNNNFPAEKRIQTHLRENQRNNIQNKWLTEIIEIAKKQNHNLYICIAPARKDYRDLLPNKDILFQSLYETIKDTNKVELINLYDSENFNTTDFCDTDHLNLIGANKLTKIINEFMI